MKEPKSRQYPTYSGTEPYAFISYAHADAGRVLPVIGTLNGERIRLWYDAGIQAGTTWPEVVASHLLHAGTAVFFLTERFLLSQNCIREVHYAVAERKPIVCVFLESIELPNDLAMQFSTATVIHAVSAAPETIAAELKTRLGTTYLGDGVTGYETARTEQNRHNVWRVVSIVFALFFLLTVLFVVGYFADWFPFLGTKTVTAESPAASDGADGTVDVTVFKDSFSRDVLLSGYEGASLYLCGSAMVSDPSAIRYADGVWTVGDTAVAAGDAGTLEFVVQKKGIRYLALVNEGVESFDALSSMPQLVYLDISGNPATDLAFLQSLTELKTLKLIDVPVSDYSVLYTLPALETVYVDFASADAVLDALKDRAVDVVVKR